MKNQLSIFNRTADARRADFGAFRLDALALNPDLRAATSAAQCREDGSWMLCDAGCRDIVSRLVADVRRARAEGLACDVEASAEGVIDAMNLSGAAQPRGVAAYLRFFAGFVCRAITLAAHIHLAAAAQPKRAPAAR